MSPLATTRVNPAVVCVRALNRVVVVVVREVGADLNQRRADERRKRGQRANAPS